MEFNIDEEREALQNLVVSELHQKYAELWKEEARSRNRPYLIRRILWRLQANREGDLTKRARQRAAELADEAEVRTTPPRKIGPRKKQGARATGGLRDVRLPPVGTSLTRDYKDTQVVVNVVDGGFEYEGERYKSLSAIANAITGSHTNGFRFFGLEGNS
jgi:hypothetical protein